MSCKDRIRLAIAWFILSIVAAVAAFVSVLYSQLWLSVPLFVLSFVFDTLILVTAYLPGEEDQL